MMKRYLLIGLWVFLAFNIKAQENTVQEEDRTQYFPLISYELKGMKETLLKEQDRELYLNSFVIYKPSGGCKNGCTGACKNDRKEYRFFLKVDELKKAKNPFSFDKAMAELQAFFKDKYLFSSDITQENLVAIYRERFYVGKNKELVDIWFFEFDVKAEQLCRVTAGNRDRDRIDRTLLVPYLSSGVIPFSVQEIGEPLNLFGNGLQTKWAENLLPWY